MKIPDWNTTKKQEKTIKIHYPEFYKYLMQNYPSDLPFIEKIYWYINKINSHPTCKVCGSPVTFKDSKTGYHQVCSLKCRNANPDTIRKKQETLIKRFGSIEDSKNYIKEKTKQTLIDKYGSVEASYQERHEKTKQTNLERYGVECNMETEEFQEKTKQTLIDKYGSVEASYQERHEKTKQTNLERYGVEYNMGTKEFQEKSKQTNLERYGVENVASNEFIKEKVKQTLIDKYGSVEASYQERHEKTKQTNLERYGVEYAQQNKYIANKSKISFQKRILEKYEHIIDTILINDEINYIIKCPHPTCTKCEEKKYTIPSSLYWTRYNRPTEMCTILAPIKKCQNSGTGIELVIRSILDKYNIVYETNVRNIISPLELDIYIPSKKLAIECNGIRWHSTRIGNKSYKYHQNKYLKCLELGIQLITFWEDQITYKYDIIESIIKSKLGIIDNVIFARKCIVKEIDKSLCSNFLNENHIQGEDKSLIKLGLFYNNALISVMTFNKGYKCSGSKIKSNNEWDLNRFCTLTDTRVVGGASKLLNHFIKMILPNSIVSYACLDISDGNLYKKLGFDEVNTSIGYWYVDPKTYKRYHRSTFTKAKLIKEGYDPNMTENEIMMMKNYYKIYDCGRKKYVLKLKS